MKSSQQSFHVLPNLRSTEEAIAFGREMTRDQYLLVEGARQALKREFDQRMRALNDLEHSALRHCLDDKAELAVKMQLLREAQEEAPFHTLFAVHRS